MLEMQNCLAEAVMKLSEQNATALECAAIAHNEGKFAAVFEAPAYCRSTDAFCGVSKSVAIFDTPEAAALAIEKEANDSEGEVSGYIFPKVKAPAPAPEAPSAPDDCPF